MRQDLQVKLLQRFFESRQARTTDMADHLFRNPVAAYTDPDRERERRHQTAMISPR